MRLRSAAPTRGRCSRSSERAAALRAAVGTRAAAPRSGHPDERYELAPFQLIEEHFNPMPARAGLQNIELAGISQGGTSLHTLPAISQASVMSGHGRTGASRHLALPAL